MRICNRRNAKKQAANHSVACFKLRLISSLYNNDLLTPVFVVISEIVISLFRIHFRPSAVRSQIMFYSNSAMPPIIPNMALAIAVLVSNCS